VRRLCDSALASSSLSSLVVALFRRCSNAKIESDYKVFTHICKHTGSVPDIDQMGSRDFALLHANRPRIQEFGPEKDQHLVQAHRRKILDCIHTNKLCVCSIYKCFQDLKAVDTLAVARRCVSRRRWHAYPLTCEACKHVHAYALMRAHACSCICFHAKACEV
jgi:hypothetical protein